MGIDPPAPDAMVGSMSALSLPPGLSPLPIPAEPMTASDETRPCDPLHDELLRAYAIQVPVHPWPATSDSGRDVLRLLRISAQRYNQPSQYRSLATSLARLLVPV